MVIMRIYESASSIVRLYELIHHSSPPSCLLLECKKLPRKKREGRGLLERKYLHLLHTMLLIDKSIYSKYFLASDGLNSA